jgi:leucyl aminopeptidase
MIEVKSIKSMAKKCHSLYLVDNKTDFKKIGLSPEAIKLIQSKFADKTYFVGITLLSDKSYFQHKDGLKTNTYERLEELRCLGNKLNGLLNNDKQTQFQISGFNTDDAMAFAEGFLLSNYQFLKYKTKDNKPNTLKQLIIHTQLNIAQSIDNLISVCEAVFMARDLVNEPQSYLSATKLAEEMAKMGKKAGFKVSVLNKSQIQTLKMGGLLAVNKGSKTPPTFTIAEYKPAKPINKKPIVLVGKGVVYDTGGLSLKPTSGMDTMKCDMAGAAAVGAAMYAIAKSKLNVHVIALIPATDNRPGENAYTPGDVIHMYDGQTVEVLNTDAEGRMILADALAYAKKYKPELVLDFATLTGAAAAAIGQYGIVCMGNATEKTKEKLKESGNQVHERLVEFPFWDDYGKLIKSDIADLKNIGGPVGGAITAGKFLAHFTDYDWMHFDIAGPAFLASTDQYRGKNGTGVGVRFIFDFIQNYVSPKK